MNPAPRPTYTLWILSLTLGQLGIGAIYGGSMLVLDPTGASMQWSLAMLEHSPFHDFLIPGLTLGTVFGIGSFAALVAIWLRPRWTFAESLTSFTGKHWSWSLAFAIGLGQVIWIVTEVLMTREISWLQPICAGLGIAIMLLSLEPGFRRYWNCNTFVNPEIN